MDKTIFIFNCMKTSKKVVTTLEPLTKLDANPTAKTDRTMLMEVINNEASR